MNNFEKIGKTIEKILINYGIDKKVKESEIIVFWEEVTGKKIAEKTTPLKVIDGKLFIKVSNPSWRNELMLVRPKIIKKINSRIGSQILKEIIFV